METNDPAPSIESLLRHGEWVRSVALRLVSDEHAADDIVQDSWLAAIKSPPPHAGHLRGWLGRVLSNRAREQGRAESRRREREQRVARPETDPAIEDLAKRAETQRQVVGHVLELDEPFRSVVLLRFFEDISPPEISDRLNIPLKTVHSRLQRAFEKLRSKLDSEYGGRDAWCIAFMPLAKLADPLAAPTGFELATIASTSTTITATTAGAWIMGTNAKLVLAAVVLLGGAWGLYSQGVLDSGELPIAKRDEALAATSPAVGKSAPESLPGNPVAFNQRESVGTPAVEEEPDQSDPPEGLITVSGRVIDVEGQAVPKVDIKVRGVEQQGEARTDADGRFEVNYIPSAPSSASVRAGETYLCVETPGWATLRESSATEDNIDSEHLIVAVRTFAAEGWVRDLHGNPIDGARLTLNPQGRSFYGFDHVLDKTRPVELKASTGAAGRFFVEAFPSCPGLRATVFAEGFLVETIEMDEVEWPLEIELKRPEDEDTPLLEGIVLDDRGLAIAGATVKFATNETTSGPDGRFRLPLVSKWINDTTRLCAAHEGHQAALIENYGALVKAQLPTPAPVELQLGPQPLSIRGRVLDADGIPWPDWTIKLVDATEVSQNRVPIVSAEAMSGLSQQPIKTGEAGNFEIHGLFDRAYTLQAFDSETLRMVETEVQAGTQDAVLEVDRITPVLFLGRLLDSNGEPLEGVRASLSMTVESVNVGFSSVTGRSVLSDSDGWFELEYVPSASIYVSYSGEQIIPSRRPLPRVDPGEPQDVELARRCHFLIELSENWSHADEAKFEDEAGESLQVHRYHANGSSSFSVVTLRDGVSEPLATSGTAHTLILLKAGVELHRMPVQLIGDGVQVLRP